MGLMARPEPSARKFRRLYSLITQNLAYETFAVLRVEAPALGEGLREHGFARAGPFPDLESSSI